MISLLHTTARPFVCDHAALAWFKAATYPDQIEHVVTYEPTYFKPRQEPISPFQYNTIEPCLGSVVMGWNRCAEIATALPDGNIFVVISDDTFPERGWDRTVVRLIGDPRSDKVLWARNECTVADGSVQKLHWDLICHPILTCSYYERYGYLFHPDYFARFSDMEFTDQALRDGVVIDARESLAFLHQDHHAPEFVMDESNRLINERHPSDEETYKARKAAGFPREWKAWGQ